MDNILNKLESLAALAAGRADPVPLDASGVMARIRGLEAVDDAQYLPIGFFAGGAAAAAAAAVTVSVFALAAWNELSSPVTAMDSLLDVMDIML